MLGSGDGKTRDLVSTVAGAGWDFGLSRHPYHAIEAPFGPHYTVYNRRHMAVCFDKIDTVEGYWLLRQKAAVLHTGEWPVEFRGPDAERLLNDVFKNDSHYRFDRGRLYQRGQTALRHIASARLCNDPNLRLKRRNPL